MSGELDEICEFLMVLGEFGTPRTKRLDFSAIIGGTILPEARELLLVATQQRDTLMDGIENSGQKVNSYNVVSSVEHYLPSLYKLLHSM